MAAHHTFGDSCMLKEESNAFTRRASTVAIDPPKITAQFFYCSPLPIDDPLAAIPPPSTGSPAKPSRVNPRPFSVHDNLALDSAWLKLQDAVRSPRPSSAEKGKRSEKETLRAEDSSSELYAASIPPRNSRDQSATDRTAQNAQERTVFVERTNNDNTTEIRDTRFDRTPTSGGNPPILHAEHRRDQNPPSAHSTSQDEDPQPLQDVEPISTEEVNRGEAESGLPKARRRRSFFHRKDEDKLSEDLSSPRTSTRRLSRGIEDGEEGFSVLGRSPDTTGTPFLRVSARLRRSRSRSPNNDIQEVQTDGINSDYRPKQSSPLGSSPRFPEFSSNRRAQDVDHSDSDSSSEEHRPSLERNSYPEGTGAAHVTVGISRLHVVELPSLKMGPIYWDPVHDVSSVVRGTWFYKETMYPIESDLANRIEEAYEYMKPWTPTYVDELNSCLEIGPEAEMKVAHKIWPDDPEVRPNRPGTSSSKQLLRQEQGIQEAKEVAGLASNRAAGVLAGFEPPVNGRLFARSSIIFADWKDAQILRPSQLPSVAKGRRPLAKIRKGKAVGFQVVRGFDMKLWEELHLPKRATPVPQAPTNGTAKSLKRRKSCIACESTQDKPIPTDLILVVHGIGQKLSERVESFHFTHAINAFRRQVNLELNEETVKPWLRPDSGGIMVLPINWRSTLKFEDGGLKPQPNQKVSGVTKNQFTLKDITAESLPAVRNLISDVMLDIPYYLSHHKPKMIEAVIAEANRVYRLWCINNPGFHEAGRVHLLAHSLGSVMALDILSKQPTQLPQSLGFPRTGKVRTDIFEFDTKSLFFCGSPAGFFLLLNRAPLVPRKGREKPQAEADGTSAGVAGQAGTFGCLAVDNLYNIMHYNDPVAYCLNACVDVDYASALQPAFVPSASPSWGQYLGSYFRSRAVTTPTTPMVGVNDLARRPTTARLPTTVELETHDFTKEEIAEKRMFLLNDNGQIDYTLPSGGGPLEIQYLNMLGAHSSYWTRKDFVRFLVVEVGRKPGKMETVGSIKAVKKAFGKK
ncbi:hypothetical protein ACLMJK_003571 [Lecanora helva]